MDDYYAVLDGLDASSTARCALCGLQVVGSGVDWLSKRYHKECFEKLNRVNNDRLP